MLLSLYFPRWFRYRHHSQILDGCRIFYHLLKLARDLPEAADCQTTQNVLNRNSFLAYAENITISMIGDEDKVVRRRFTL